MTRDACITVSYGGKLSEDAPWILTWLPHGFAPTYQDRYVCYFAEPSPGWGGEYGLAEGKRPPLIAAVIETIEKFMAEHPGYEIGTSTWPKDEAREDLNA